MKAIAILMLTAVIALGVINVKQTDRQIASAQSDTGQLEVVSTPEPTPSPTATPEPTPVATPVPVIAAKPVATPKPVIAQASGSCAEEIKKYPWPQQQAYNVMMIESGNNAGIVNDNPRTGDYSVGCFQINLIGAMRAVRPSEASLKNASVNVAYAYGMWKSQGGFCSTAGWRNTCKKLGLI